MQEPSLQAGRDLSRVRGSPAFPPTGLRIHSEANHDAGSAGYAAPSDDPPGALRGTSCSGAALTSG
jgi:hypothetical protein